MYENKILRRYSLIFLLLILSVIVICMIKIEISYTTSYFVKNEYTKQHITMESEHLINKLFVQDGKSVKKGEPILSISHSTTLPGHEKYKLIKKYITEKQTLTHDEKKFIKLEIEYINNVNAKLDDENTKINEKRKIIEKNINDSNEYMQYLNRQKESVKQGNIFYENYHSIRNKLRSNLYTNEEKKFIRDEEKNKTNELIIANEKELLNYSFHKSDEELLSYFAQLYLQSPNKTAYEKIIYAETEGTVQLSDYVVLNKEYTINQEIITVIPRAETIKIYVVFTPNMFGRLDDQGGYFFDQGGDKVKFDLKKNDYDYDQKTNSYYVAIDLVQSEKYIHGEQGVAHILTREESLINVIKNLIFNI